MGRMEDTLGMAMEENGRHHFEVEHTDLSLVGMVEHRDRFEVEHRDLSLDGVVGLGWFGSLVHLFF